MKEMLKKYAPKGDMTKITSFVTRHAKKMGVQLVYSSLLLFYAFKQKDTPCWAKNIIFGLIGYLLTPVDFIPDLTPILGFTDDLSILLFGMVMISCYIDKDVRTKSRARLENWFKEIPEQELAAVDARL